MQELKSTADIARKLGVGTSTLRKYAAAMEEKGYRFERAANQSRMFSQKDMERFRLLKTALRENNLLLSEAVEQALFAEDGQRAEHDIHNSGSVGMSVTSGMEEEPAMLLYSAKRAEKGDELRYLVEAVTAAASEKEYTGKAKAERMEEDQPSLSRRELNETLGQDIHMESAVGELQSNSVLQSDQPLSSGQRLPLDQPIQSGSSMQSDQAGGSDQPAQTPQTPQTEQQISLRHEALSPDWDKLYRRIEELEEGQLQLQQLNSQLTAQLEEQKNWIKERTEEERDRQLITSLRTYQGRKKKTRSSIFALLGLVPRKSREA
ncbi:MerR family transcriptional regulator [Paenibacillus massiliensis]|uniref:hypothetical protein n=1 Tax=Paenibacillus massiliensis TaxID=225917 RepID=UPI0004148C52|nr:hypothetical protein [Paenibacillus massiliensis]